MCCYYNPAVALFLLSSKLIVSASEKPCLQGEYLSKVGIDQKLTADSIAGDYGLTNMYKLHNALDIECIAACVCEDDCTIVEIKKAECTAYGAYEEGAVTDILETDQGSSVYEKECPGGQVRTMGFCGEP